VSTTLKSIEQLDVFQLSHKLAIQIYKLTSTFPRTELYGLTSQLRRASSSIPMNLCEGANRLSKAEYRHFVGIARGSTGEIWYQLMLAKDLGYLEEKEYIKLRKDYERVGQMLTKLSQSLQRD
jgi:four helix bundle protein